MDMEQHIPKPIQQGQEHNQEEWKHCMKSDASGVGQGVSPLHVRDRMWFSRNEAHDNAALWPIEFINKCLTSAETKYSKIEKEVLSIIHGLENFITNASTLRLAWSQSTNCS